MKNKKILLMACLLSLQTLIHAATAERSLALVAVKPTEKPARVKLTSEQLAAFLTKVPFMLLSNSRIA